MSALEAAGAVGPSRYNGRPVDCDADRALAPEGSSGLVDRDGVSGEHTVAMALDEDGVNNLAVGAHVDVDDVSDVLLTAEW